MNNTDITDAIASLKDAARTWYGVLLDSEGLTQDTIDTHKSNLTELEGIIKTLVILNK